MTLNTLHPPSQEEFIIKSRSIRIAPSIFPSDLLSDSKEFKNQIQCGQSYDNGMKMIHHKIKNMYPLLQLEPNLYFSLTIVNVPFYPLHP